MAWTTIAIPATRGRTYGEEDVLEAKAVGQIVEKGIALVEFEAHLIVLVMVTPSLEQPFGMVQASGNSTGEHDPPVIGAVLNLDV